MATNDGIIKHDELVRMSKCSWSSEIRFSCLHEGSKDVRQKPRDSRVLEPSFKLGNYCTQIPSARLYTEPLRTLFSSSVP